LYYHKYYKAKHGESENHQYKKDWVIVWLIFYRLINFLTYTTVRI
jgi:hypothetical protein